MCFGLLGCLGAPEGVTPVKDFDLDRYLGKWYEVARLDHSFERGLNGVTAEYSMREDGGVRVMNSGVVTPVEGFHGAEERSEAEGRAYFVEGTDLGYLKVSFFGPFFGSYIVFELDTDNYQYAFVAGNNTNYLWLLARTPEVSDEVMARFIARSSALGFATDELIFVQHSAD
ncbi:lipocalin family protein [Porticoccaceae bacterium]|nr:lipocalin family protein [Porticoccaceae bacterium]